MTTPDSDVATQSLEQKIIVAVVGKPLSEDMPVPNFVEKIMRAVESEGYAKYMIDLSKPPLSEYGEQLMTGREWYERFENELKLIGKPGYAFTQYGMLKAAKRAAGIEDD